MSRQLCRGGLGNWRRKIARLDFGMKANPFMAAVAERLVLGLPAPAKADHRASSQTESPTLHIANRNLTLDSK